MYSYLKIDFRPNVCINFVDSGCQNLSNHLHDKCSGLAVVFNSKYIY